MRRRFTIIAMAVVLVLSVVGVASATPKNDKGEHKVSLCHATSSATNPWVVITVDVASTQYRAHDEHVHKDGREDIIPVDPETTPEKCQELYDELHGEPSGDEPGDGDPGDVEGVVEDPIDEPLMG